jgi:hypothetical protein
MSVRREIADFRVQIADFNRQFNLKSEF